MQLKLRRLGEDLVTSIDGEDPTKNEGGTNAGQNTLEDHTTIATTLVNNGTNDSSNTYDFNILQQMLPGKIMFTMNRMRPAVLLTLGKSQKPIITKL